MNYKKNKKRLFENENLFIVVETSISTYYIINL
jgi:hypothetical protein